MISRVQRIGKVSELRFIHSLFCHSTNHLVDKLIKVQYNHVQPDGWLNKQKSEVKVKIAASTAKSVQESDERRHQILAAAQALIAEEGLEGFRIREVAQRAGLHHASLLHYYPNRSALVRGVVEQIVSQLDRVPAEDTAEAALSPREILHAHFQHVLTQILEEPAAFIVLNELFLRAMRDEEVQRILATTEVSWRNYLVPLLSKGIAQTTLRSDLEPEAVAVLIMSFFKGLTMQLTLSAEQTKATVVQFEEWLFQK